jgi:hypothetical protein
MYLQQIQPWARALPLVLEQQSKICLYFPSSYQRKRYLPAIDRSFHRTLPVSNRRGKTKERQSRSIKIVAYSSGGNS